MDKEMRKKVGFLILHYKNFDATRQCINSILGLNKQNEMQIVIVDNGSLNGSCEKLKKEFDSDNIHIIELEHNVGFSKANNIGYKYIKRFDLDFIIVANNDIIFKDKGMIEKLYNIFDRKRFYVLGPDIYVEWSNIHQSPFSLGMPTVQEIERELEREKKELYFYDIRKVVLRIKNFKFIDYIYKKIKYDLLGFSQGLSINRVDEEYDYPYLHGACLIFSRLFVDEIERCGINGIEDGGGLLPRNIYVW